MGSMIFALDVVFDTFVEDVDRTIENHLVAQADINAIAMAVSVADTKIDFLRVDLRRADAVAVVVNVLAEGLRASISEEHSRQDRNETDVTGDS